MRFSESLQAARRQCGISQMEAAERLGVSRQTIYRWESGESEPTLENLRSLADLYGMAVDELLNGPAEPDVPEEDAAEPPQDESDKIELLSNRPYTALADRKTVQVAALAFVVIYGGVMSQLDIPGDIIGSGVVYLILRNFFFKQFRELDYSENPIFHQFWCWAFVGTAVLQVIVGLAQFAIRKIAGIEMDMISIGGFVNTYLAVYLLGLVLFHKPQGTDAPENENDPQ